MPYVLFAYREVPCQSTGYSPFELLYGRTIRGPLSVIKEVWTPTKVAEDYLSYVLESRKWLIQMQEIVQENLKITQAKQKKLYDQQSSRRQLNLGDKVLVLLPSSGSKLEMQWQGPFVVSKVLDNGLNYEVDKGRGEKQKRVFIYINLLKLWKTREEFASSGPVSNEIQEDCNSWVEREETWRDVEISPELDAQQLNVVRQLLQEYSDIFSNIPSCMTVIEHGIDTGEAKPVRSSPYQIPQSLISTVKSELYRMLDMGIVRPSRSVWASPIVIKPKPDGTIRFCIDYRKSE